jgi:hypothetical protein
MLLMARIGGGSVRHPSGWSLYLAAVSSQAEYLDLGFRIDLGQPGTGGGLDWSDPKILFDAALA